MGPVSGEGFLLGLQMATSTVSKYSLAWGMVCLEATCPGMPLKSTRAVRYSLARFRG